MKCKKIATLLLALVCLLPIPSMASAIATVNGKAIEKKDVDDVVSVLIKNGGTDTVDLRELIKQQLIDQELVLQECFRLHFDKQTAFQDKLKKATRSLLMEMFLEQTLKENPVKESDIRNLYSTIKSNLTGSRDVHLRHILVKTESEAKNLIDIFKKDAAQSFEKVAQSKSIDPQAKKNGGDMGILNSKILELKFPMLSGVLLPLGKGQISPLPIKSNSGWHIFKIEDIQDVRIPSYDELRPQLLNDLQRQAVKKAIEALRAKAEIK